MKNRPLLFHPFYLTLILLQCIKQPCGHNVAGQLHKLRDVIGPAKAIATKRIAGIRSVRTERAVSKGMTCQHSSIIVGLLKMIKGSVKAQLNYLNTVPAHTYTFSMEPCGRNYLSPACSRAIYDIFPRAPVRGGYSYVFV